MSGTFSTLDWVILFGYLVLLLGIGWVFSRKQSHTIQDYFLGNNSMAPWVVAISVIATTQSAATFMGGPDQGYRGDYTYLAANIAAVLGSCFVARTLIPRFYAQGSTTVYELLEKRYGSGEMRDAGMMYIIGRLVASGARRDIATSAVSMM